MHETAAAAVENTLSAKEDSKGSSTDFWCRVDRCREIKDVSTFSASHSKHIHQPATFPRINYKKKIKKNTAIVIKRRPFLFSGSRNSQQRGGGGVTLSGRYPIPKLGSASMYRAWVVSENPAGETDTFNSSPPPPPVGSRLNNKL